MADQITYSIDVVYSKDSSLSFPVPTIPANDPIIIRTELIKSLEGTKSSFLTPDAIMSLRKSGTVWGVSFFLNEEKKGVAIYGYEGYIPGSTIIDNKALELELYRKNGWDRDINLETIYSVTQKKMIEVINNKQDYILNN